MRRVVFALAGFLLVIAKFDAGASEPFRVDSLAPGVFVHLGRQLALAAPGHDDIANLGFVVGKKCVAVIDSGGSVRSGRALRAAVADRTSLPVCYVINTHVHVDHVLGNAAFLADHAQFVGHAQLAGAIARSRELLLRDYAADLDAPATAAQIVEPTVAVADTLHLDLGGRRLTLRAWPTAHTDCDLSVLDESSGTLFAGDLLFRERIPAVDGSAKGWIVVIDDLSRMKAQRVVPGHGPVASDARTAFAPERRYLQALVVGVRAAIVQGESMNTAITHVGLAEKSHWLLWDSAHAHNIARVYQELEWE